VLRVVGGAVARVLVLDARRVLAARAMRLGYGASLFGAEAEQELQVLGLAGLRALRRLHLLHRDVAHLGGLLIAPRLEEPVQGLEAPAIFGTARRALRRGVLVHVLRAHRLAVLLLPVAGAVDAKLAGIHRLDRLLALRDLVGAHLREGGRALRLRLLHLLPRGRLLLAARLLRLLGVAAAELTAGHIHRHVAVARLHLHGALVLGARGVESLLDDARPFGARDADRDAVAGLLVVGDLAVLPRRDDGLALGGLLVADLVGLRAHARRHAGHVHLRGDFPKLAVIGRLRG